ncbi:MAG: alkaline phytoceramidase [Actinomycetota bacterium]
MKRWLTFLPPGIVLAAVTAMLVHGPIPQLANYHDFADQSVLLGLPHGADVASNLGFALVGLWGWLCLFPERDHPALRAGWPGYGLFLAALTLTAVGSSFYHWAPDNARLLWDRLPIALACAGLLAAVRGETRSETNCGMDTISLAAFAVGSVAWWYLTESLGRGDLRPYLLLQGAPLALVPLWQWIYGAPRADRVWFGAALGFYIHAKGAEVYDHQLLAALGWISGHTLKHLLATAAAWLLVWRLAGRVRSPRED